jgi:hypothetical protein
MSREPNKQRRDICTVSCSTTAMTRWSMSPTWALSSTAGRPSPRGSHPCDGVEFGDHENAPREVLLSRTLAAAPRAADQVRSFVGRARTLDRSKRAAVMTSFTLPVTRGVKRSAARLTLPLTMNLSSHR